MARKRKNQHPVEGYFLLQATYLHVWKDITHILNADIGYWGIDSSIVLVGKVVQRLITAHQSISFVQLMVGHHLVPVVIFD